MGVKLLNKNNRILTTVSELKDGQIAIMVDNAYACTIVQRYGSNLVAIGKRVGYGWSSCDNNMLTVRVLEEGELIEIVNNQ